MTGQGIQGKQARKSQAGKFKKAGRDEAATSASRTPLLACGKSSTGSDFWQEGSHLWADAVSLAGNRISAAISTSLSLLLSEACLVVLVSL
jgi:hypothetical protein